MAKNLNQLVVVARPGKPKALDLDSLADRSMELPSLALSAAMLAAAVLASLVHAVHLAWSVCLAGLPVALAVAAFAPRIRIAAAGAFVLAQHPAFGTVARARGAAPGLRTRTRWLRGAVAAGFGRGWRRGLR